MYYLDCHGMKFKKDKGIVGAVKEKLINGEYYIDALLGDTFYVNNQTRIAVKDHQLYTLQENKKALCANDTKRFITDDPTFTRALGHYKNRV